MKSNQRPTPTESFLGIVLKPKWLAKNLLDVYPVKIEKNKIVISFNRVEMVDSNDNPLDSRYVSKKISKKESEKDGKVTYVLEDGETLVFEIKRS